MAELVSIRLVYGKTLVELGRANPDIVALDADLCYSTKTCRFRDALPNRFFDMGISEADMMGTAAGLASCGKTVFASTFAVFASGRAWDQIRISIAYQRLNVKIVATHGGISVGEDGYTHHAIEDIAIMRVLPNMRVIVPCDGLQTETVIRLVAEEKGPFYVRLTRPPLATIYKNRHTSPNESLSADSVPLRLSERGRQEGGRNFELGKANVLREGKDVTIAAMGSMVHQALEAHKILKSKGFEARVLDMASIKPIDEESIKKACDETKGIVTCEDHSVIGGLGDAVAQIILSHHPVSQERIGIQNVVTESGSPQALYEKYGLTSAHIAEKAMSLLR